MLVPAPLDGPPALAEDEAWTNPFVRYRGLLYSHRVALARGMSDADYVKMAHGLNEALMSTGGTEFLETPLVWNEELNCFFKIEVANVAQSHKARHLANVMLYLLALKNTGETALGERRLAVASCGNAGLAAAEVAAAARWPIDVCIPPDADEAVIDRLAELAPHGVATVICDRSGADVQTAAGPVSTTNAADPTLSVCRSLVADHGSLPFSVQGPECGLAVEGGQTLAWEVLTALRRDHPTVDKLNNFYVQVGGGALGAGLGQGFRRAIEGGELPTTLTSMPTLRCVQPTGCQPLGRAFDKMSADNLSAAEAGQKRGAYMWPWDNPKSVAHGILDDETYDWAQLCEDMRLTGGGTIAADDDAINAAHSRVHNEFGVPVCHTGAAGLAGMLLRRKETPEAAGAPPDLVILSGLHR